VHNVATLACMLNSVVDCRLRGNDNFFVDPIVNDVAQFPQNVVE
jgi:hypothetical protein